MATQRFQFVLSCAVLLVAASSIRAEQQPIVDPNAVLCDEQCRKGQSVLGTQVLNTNNIERLEAYYKLLDFKVLRRYGEKPRRAVLFNIHAGIGVFGPGISLHEMAEPLVLGNGSLYTVYIVQDIRAICKKLADAKMPCTREPKVEPNETNAIVARAVDPDGRDLELLQKP